MGIWGAPHTKEQKVKLRRKLAQLKRLQDEIGSLFGDDRLLDSFCETNERIEYALLTDWGPEPVIKDEDL